MLGLLPLQPDLAVVAGDDVAHREGRTLAGEAHGLELPGHHGLGAHRLPRPDEVEVRQAAGAAETEAHLADLELVRQPAGQVANGLQQREAVDLDPHRRVHVLELGGQAHLVLDPTLGRGDQVGAVHVVEGPARLEGVGEGVGGLLQPAAHGLHLVADHLQEAVFQLGLQVGVFEHLGRGAQIGQRRAAALGDRMEQLVAAGLAFEIAGDVVQHQHEARHRALRIALDGAHHRRHLHPQQLAGAGGGDEVGQRTRALAADALLDALQGMDDQVALEDQVDRAAQADDLAAAGRARGIREGLELQPGPAVVKQDAAVEVADDDALVELRHQRREPVALLLDRQPRLANPRLHVFLEALALVGQAVDGFGDALQLRRAGGLEAARRIGADQQADLVGQQRRRFDALLGEGLHEDGRRTGADQADHDQQAQARIEDGHQHGPLLGAQILPQGDGSPREHPDDERRDGDDGQCLPGLRAHAGRSSSDFTLVTSSRVENGLVL